MINDSCCIQMLLHDFVYKTHKSYIVEKKKQDRCQFFHLYFSNQKMCIYSLYFYLYLKILHSVLFLAQAAGAAEYNDCISAEG